MLFGACWSGSELCLLVGRQPAEHFQTRSHLLKASSFFDNTAVGELVAFRRKFERLLFWLGGLLKDPVIPQQTREQVTTDSESKKKKKKPKESEKVDDVFHPDLLILIRGRRSKQKNGEKSIENITFRFARVKRTPFGPPRFGSRLRSTL